MNKIKRFFLKKYTFAIFNSTKSINNNERVETMKRIRMYFHRRLKKIKYYEFLDTKNSKDEIFIIVGDNGDDNDEMLINRNTFIFLLELKAYIDGNPNAIKTSIPKKEKKNFTVYRILKFKTKGLIRNTSY